MLTGSDFFMLILIQTGWINMPKIFAGELSKKPVIKGSVMFQGCK